MKNKILRVALLVLAIVIIVVLAVLGVTRLIDKKPEASVKSFVEALKAGDFETVKKYTSDETWTALEIVDNSEDEDLEMMKLYFKCLNIKVVQVTKSRNQAIVKAEITNKDLKTILGNYIQEALKLALQNISSKEDQETMENQLKEYFKSQFESEEITNVNNTVDIVLNKVDGQWKVVVDENLRDALLPGLSEVSNMYSFAA